MKAILLASPIVVALALGCGASKPSPQLLNARSAYQRARTSDAATYTPARVLTAKQALDRAERAHRNDPGSFEEKSLAYIAQRQAELAEAYADLAKAEREREAAEALYRERQVQLRAQAEESLQETQTDLEAARRQLAAEGAARAEAEQRLEEAMRNLSALGQVRQESRGTVVTLDGQVLFETGSSDLAPPARERLGDVARALSTLHPSQTIIVEGHTDSRGAEDMNMRLSQERAETVRQQLIQSGVPAERIRAVGRGEEQPIASNDTPEGRANNRRVEIVITPIAGTEQPGTTPSGPSGTESPPTTP